jgi:glutamate-1-semialdehyde aminotransferase
VRAEDAALRARAAKVIPGGMYGHLNVGGLPPAYAQFYERAEGARVWDVDGNEYVDLMCAFGPNILGYGHAGVEQAAGAQRVQGDTQAGPTPVMVELAELMVDRLSHADWAIFSKNGNDATGLALAIARAATGRSAVLMAANAYHGSAGWCNPNPSGFPGSSAISYSATGTTISRASRRPCVKPGRRRLPRSSSRRSGTTLDSIRNWPLGNSRRACARCATRVAQRS